MRPKSSIGIKKNSFKALLHQPFNGNVLKFFYLHKGVQPGRIEWQGKKPGNFGPSQALTFRRRLGCLAHWRSLVIRSNRQGKTFGCILHAIKWHGKIFLRKLKKNQVE
jgi:hypothetical protein